MASECTFSLPRASAPQESTFSTEGSTGASRPSRAQIQAPQPFTRKEMAAALEGSQHDDEAALMRRLRQLRSRVLLRVMARDLAGLAELEEVCGAMTDLAELAIAAALDEEELMVVG